MTTININEAKTHLSRYARMVKAGETIILCDRNKPFAEIRPLENKTPGEKRKLGQLEGTVRFAESFFDADAEVEKAFLTGDIFPDAEVSAPESPKP